jgi:Domain of unknown function (DUF4129)
MLAGAMSARIGVAVIALTTLICVVAVTGGEPIARDGEPEPYIPTREDLVEAGVITAEFPVPGALPPEVFPPEAYGIGPPQPPAWLPWVLVALALLWAAAGLVREVRAGRIEWRPRRVAQDEPEPDNAVVAREAIDAALAPLREPADARAAVIEAYARMEQVLAGRALGRREAEAPREYLRRVLGERGVPERSLSALTALFEEARFSRHPITESASRAAATELQAVRAALE